VLTKWLQTRLCTCMHSNPQAGVGGSLLCYGGGDQVRVDAVCGRACTGQIVTSLSADSQVQTQPKLSP
jgi:hypothetical protein